jgi:hypothetical protein
MRKSSAGTRKMTAQVATGEEGAEVVAQQPPVRAVAVLGVRGGLGAAANLGAALAARWEPSRREYGVATVQFIAL